LAQSNGQDLKTQIMMKTLDQPLAMTFPNPTPLQDVLKYIKQALKDSHGNPIPIYIDPKGLEQAGFTLSSPVAIDLVGVPLKTSLRLILKQLDLAYCVRDGVLIISSVQGVREELAEAASELSGKDPELMGRIMQSMGGMGGGMMGGTGGMGMM
jgi:hypothetical protein